MRLVVSLSGQFEPKLRDEDKNPVQRINELCQKQRKVGEFFVDEDQGDYGYVVQQNCVSTALCCQFSNAA